MLSFRSGMLSPPPIPLAEATHSLPSNSRADEIDFPIHWGEPGRCEHLWSLSNGYCDRRHLSVFKVCCAKTLVSSVVCKNNTDANIYKGEGWISTYNEKMAFTGSLSAMPRDEPAETGTLIFLAGAATTPHGLLAHSPLSAAATGLRLSFPKAPRVSRCQTGGISSNLPNGWSPASSSCWMPGPSSPYWRRFSCLYRTKGEQ